MTCARLGVPFYAIDMEAEFGAAVVDRFVSEYAAGRTPNPCLECNRHVKFRHLVRRAKLLGAHCLATGHYARIVQGDPETGEPHRLFRAVDARKDQSYVLYTMDQEQLGYVRFPLGELTKPETRRLARSFGLPVADKSESQEICFVGNGRGAYADFVAARRPDVAAPGEIVDTGGAVVGRHRGLVHHTVGQRRGLGVAAGAPLYVVGLDPAANRVRRRAPTANHAGCSSEPRERSVTVRPAHHCTRMPAHMLHRLREGAARRRPVRARVARPVPAVVFAASSASRRTARRSARRR
jgi:tRNA-specific 2-thiouridylase